MRKKLRISKVRSSIIRAEGKPFGGEEKLAVRAVPRHPCRFQRGFSGKIQGALHRNAYRPSGAENSNALSTVAILRELGQPALYTRAEICPGFNAFQLQLAIRPSANHNFKDPLKCFELLWTRF